MLLNCGVGEDSWESLGVQGDPTVHPKGDQSWVFIRRTDTEAETPVLWPPDEKSWLIWKHPDAGKDWGQEEKGMTEDEMVGWHHQLNGHGFGWTPGVGDRERDVVCCDSWGLKESDTAEWLNWLTCHEAIRKQCLILSTSSFLFSFFVCPKEAFREGNGTPLQYSCLENPMDGEAW